MMDIVYIMPLYVLIETLLLTFTMTRILRKFSVYLTRKEAFEIFGSTVRTTQVITRIFETAVTFYMVIRTISYLRHSIHHVWMDGWPCYKFIAIFFGAETLVFLIWASWRLYAHSEEYILWGVKNGSMSPVVIVIDTLILCLAVSYVVLYITTTFGPHLIYPDGGVITR